MKLIKTASITFLLTGLFCIMLVVADFFFRFLSLGQMLNLFILAFVFEYLAIIAFLVWKWIEHINEYKN